MKLNKLNVSKANEMKAKKFLDNKASNEVKQSEIHKASWVI